MSLGIRSVTNPLATFNVNNDANFQNYSFSFYGPAPRPCEIRFFNDGTSSGIDRNLYVDYITLNGSRLEVGGRRLLHAGQSELCRCGGARESLYVNGTLTFDDLPDSGPDDPVAILLAQPDLKTNATYAPGAVGSAVLRIMDGVDNIRASNFSAGSFQVENTGAKKISGIFIDVRGALYPDSVFDPDGAGGDSVTKPWAIDRAGRHRRLRRPGPATSCPGRTRCRTPPAPARPATAASKARWSSSTPGSAAASRTGEIVDLLRRHGPELARRSA